MFVRSKTINGNDYFYLVKEVRVPNRKNPKQINIDYLGSVDLAEVKKCRLCGREKKIYQKHNCCEDCLEKIPELKEMAERKTKRAKRKI